MEELSFNKTQLKQLVEVVTHVVTPIVNNTITASEKRLRKDIIDQADAVKRDIRDEFKKKLDGVEKRLRKEIRDFRIEVAERFSETVYNRFDDHEHRLARLEKKFA